MLVACDAATIVGNALENLGSETLPVEQYLSHVVRIDAMYFAEVFFVPADFGLLEVVQQPAVSYHFAVEHLVEVLVILQILERLVSHVFVLLSIFFVVRRKELFLPLAEDSMPDFEVAVFVSVVVDDCVNKLFWEWTAILHYEKRFLVIEYGSNIEHLIKAA